MTREANKRLLIVAGLTLLMAAGVVLPLRAAPAPRPASSQAAEDRVLEAAAIIPATDVSQTLAPTTTTLTVTLTLTNILTPIFAQTPATTLTPANTLTPISTQTPTTTPTPTGTLTPTSAQTPTTTPTPTGTLAPTPSLIEIATRILTQQWSLAMLICLAPLLILGLLLILWILRRKRRPPPPPPPPPPPLPIAPHLESIGTPGGPRRFDLKPGSVTIGRATENDLVITQDFPAWETVSRRHARIYQRGGSWVVEDLGSMNGVYVNEKRTGRNLLRDNWRLSIGGVEFVFHASTGEV